jgi:hypothetical protein
MSEERQKLKIDLGPRLDHFVDCPPMAQDGMCPHCHGYLSTLHVKWPWPEQPLPLRNEDGRS